jgi:hypothetical protein
MVISFSLPVARDFVVWQSHKTEFGIMFQVMFGFSILPVPLIPIMNAYHKVRAFLDRIFNRNLVIVVALTTLFSCLLLTGLHIGGLGWTWLTAGVQVSTILLAYLMLEGRVYPVEAMLIGIGLVGIAVGSWEIPYQVGLKLNYETALPHAVMMNNLKREVLIETPFIMGGIYILFLYKAKNVIHFNRWFWLLLAATIGLYAYWFLSGFWVEMTYDWTSYQWVQHPVDIVAKTVYRASKVTLALALLSLLLPRKGETIESKRLSDNASLDSR